LSAEPFAPRDPILTCCELMVLKAREGGLLGDAVEDRTPELHGLRLLQASRTTAPGRPGTAARLSAC